MCASEGKLKAQTLELVQCYFQAADQRKSFEPGKTRVQYLGRAYDGRELLNLIGAVLDFRPTGS